MPFRCGILARMKKERFVKMVAIMLLAPLVAGLTSCGGGGGANENRSNRGLNPGVGPFDSRGNYV